MEGGVVSVAVSGFSDGKPCILGVKLCEVAKLFKACNGLLHGAGYGGHYARDEGAFRGFGS